MHNRAPIGDANDTISIIIDIQCVWIVAQLFLDGKDKPKRTPGKGGKGSAELEDDPTGTD